jgi:hypothetical protein
MPKTPGQRGLAAVVLVVVLGACTSSHPGTDADRAACSQLRTTVSLSNKHAPSAILTGNYRTTRNAALRSNDGKLRASILSITRYATGPLGTPEPDAAYALQRCRAIGAALPRNFTISPGANSN